MEKQWRKPPWTTGSEDLLRISPGTGGEGAHDCPARSAAKARPALKPRVKPGLPWPELETFTLGPVKEAVDAVEFEGASLDVALAGLRASAALLHPGHLSYAEHAVRTYAELSAGEDLEPVRPYWVAQKENGRTWELYAWWRRYASADGKVRELRRLRHGTAAESTPAEIAIGAYVAAHGRSAEWPEPRYWGRPFQPYGPEPVVEHVRIVEVGLADGRPKVQFEGSVAEADAYYGEYGHEHITRVVNGGEHRPGSGCAECKLLTGCGELRRLPGILGLPSGPYPRRTVSVSGLRSYRTCPAQSFLRELHLPKADEYSDSAKLGQAVHARLEELHRRDGHPACTAADLPASEEDWPQGRWAVPEDMAALGRQMLEGHLRFCVFRDSGLIDDVQVEPTLAFHDTAAQVVVIAKPDMVYREDGSWVWREIKTTRKRHWRNSDLLEEFPQLALAVVLLARGALGGDPAGSRVEVEVLRPEGPGLEPDVEYIDPHDSERVDKALAVLRGYAADWRADETFAARPGKHCQWCPVSRWCPSSAADAPAAAEHHDELHDEGNDREEEPR